MPLRSALSIFLVLIPCVVLAQVDDKVRLKGFAEHQKNGVVLDKERDNAVSGFKQEKLAWEEGIEKAKSSFKRERLSHHMSEDSPQAKADLKEKQIYYAEIETSRRDYVSKKGKQDLFERKSLGLPTEEEELGLIEDRPRVDYKKRASYGGRPNYSNMTSSGSARPSGGGRFSGGSNDSFPPPPNMDFDDGFVPAPNFEGEGDTEPPPPPPFPEDDYTGPEGGDDFIPPPPPPPPGFGEMEIDPIEPEF